MSEIWNPYVPQDIKDGQNKAARYQRIEDAIRKNDPSILAPEDVVWLVARISYLEQEVESLEDNINSGDQTGPR